MDLLTSDGWLTVITTATAACAGLVGAWIGVRQSTVNIRWDARLRALDQEIGEYETLRSHLAPYVHAVGRVESLDPSGSEALKAVSLVRANVSIDQRISKGAANISSCILESMNRLGTDTLDRDALFDVQARINELDLAFNGALGVLRDHRRTLTKAKKWTMRSLRKHEAALENDLESVISYSIPIV